VINPLIPALTRRSPPVFALGTPPPPPLAIFLGAPVVSGTPGILCKQRQLPCRDLFPVFGPCVPVPPFQKNHQAGYPLSPPVFSPLFFFSLLLPEHAMTRPFPGIVVILPYSLFSDQVIRSATPGMTVFPLTRSFFSFDRSRRRGFSCSVHDTFLSFPAGHPLSSTPGLSSRVFIVAEP